jgi:hypothetical protein
MSSALGSKGMRSSNDVYEDAAESYRATKEPRVGRRGLCSKPARRKARGSLAQDKV